MCPTYIWLIWKDEEKIIARETYENAYVYDHFFSSIHHYLFLLFCSFSDTIWNSKMKMFGGWPKKRQVFIVNLNFLFVLSIQQYHIFFALSLSFAVARLLSLQFHLPFFIIIFVHLFSSLLTFRCHCLHWARYLDTSDVWLGMQPISIHHQLLFFYLSRLIFINSNVRFFPFSFWLFLVMRLDICYGSNMKQ